MAFWNKNKEEKENQEPVTNPSEEKEISGLPFTSETRKTLAKK